MNRALFLFATLFAALLLVGCPKDNGDTDVNDDTNQNGDTTNQNGDATNQDINSAPYADETSLHPTALDVSYVSALDALVFELEVDGDAASVVPEAAGQLDGAPVLGYVFPVTLSPEVVGFGDVEGDLALVVVSHPDFDDTPLWDADGNGDYDDDGAIYHTHWVVLHDNDRAPAGRAVMQSDEESELPPTAPMDMYLDSPGFTVVEDGAFLRVIVPADRVRRNLDFQVGALTAYMEVDASEDQPLLAVHHIIEALDEGDTSTSIENTDEMPDFAWPDAVEDSDDSLQLEGARITYVESLGSFVFTVETNGAAATVVPEPAGQIDGAPVVGYAFQTDLEPSVVGFGDTDGQLVLAVTTHPDFDDTPLWDENMDGDYENDGEVYHVHWVVLVEDDDSPSNLSVPSQTDSDQLPPTAPMDMYLDSPGFHAFASGNNLHVIVPGWYINGERDFTANALTARMRVDASGDAPVLRVEEVVHSLEEELSPSTVGDVDEL